MRLTLTGLSSQYIHLPLAPFCLKKAVEENCPDVEVTLCDLNINDPQEDLLERIMVTRPDAVGVCMYIWNREQAVRLFRRIRAARQETLLIVGGPEATWSAEETFRQCPVDYLIRGAGEEALPALLNGLMCHEEIKNIPGVCSRRGDGYVDGGVAPAPAPRSDIYDDAWQEMRQGRMIYAETSRGCPFSCAFCLSGQKEKVRFMPKEEALAMLIRLGQAGCDTVKLIDRTFNCDRERTYFLLSGLMDAHARGEISSVCYHLEVAADLFDDKTLDLLKTAPAGLFQMEAGLQSFHLETLDACHRRTDMALLQDRLRRLIAPGNIHLHIDLIAGLPEEDYATFRDSFNQAWALHPHQLQLGRLKLIHGSALRAQDWGQRYAPDPPYEVLSTLWISYEELQKLQHCAEAVERLKNSARFEETLRLALNTLPLTPFDLMMALGEKMAQRPGRWSLDGLAEMVHGALLAWQVPADQLRDAMVTDRLATDNTGYLPPFLQRPEDKPALKSWREAHPEHKKARLALLSDGQGVLIAEWSEKHPVTGRGIVEKTVLLQG